jgi:hypothetical protein
VPVPEFTESFARHDAHGGIIPRSRNGSK